MSPAIARKPGPPRGSERTASKETRRQQLIEATIVQIAERGLSVFKITDVAKAAGLAAGMVNFHFDTKDQLLAQTLAHLTEEYRNCWIGALERAGSDPAGRLLAMIMADFDPQVCTRRKIAVWHAFYGEAKARPAVRSQCGLNEREQLTMLTTLCADLIVAGGYEGLDAGRVAGGLNAMTDGMWLAFLFSPGHIDRADAQKTVVTFLAAVFPRHFPRSAS